MITIVTGKEIEKIKGEFESVINGMNMVGKIPYNVYSELFDVGTEYIQKAYELGKSELEKQNECHDLRKNWKDLPTDESDVLCYLGRDESEVGYFHQEKKQFFTIDGKEINPVAWKEIRYPQESEK